MKVAIKEYLTLTKEEKSVLWKNAVFVFDTNVFLNLYRYTAETRKSLLDAMQQFSKRIWMPKQVAQEFMKDRPKVIFDTLKVFVGLKNEKEKFIKYCKDKLRRKDNDVNIKKMSKEIDEHMERLKKTSNYIEKVDDDEVLNKLLKLFEQKVGNGFSEEELENIHKEGKDRYSKQIPPGYKDAGKGEDNNAYGDLIIWKEILAFAKSNKKDIIYVTGDQKEDWWEIVNGHTLGPRVELKKEFFEETNQEFNMYSMERFLTQFKDVQGSKIEQRAIDEIKSYEESFKKIQEKSRYAYEFQELNRKKTALESYLNELNKKQADLEIVSNDLQRQLHEIKSDDYSDNSLQTLKLLLDKTIQIEHESKRCSVEKSSVLKEMQDLNKRRNEIVHFIKE